MKYILVFFIFIGGALTCFSQAKPIIFTDDSMLEVVHEQKNADESAKITVKNARFTAIFNSIGKAVPPLKENSLKRLAKRNKSLAAQIKKINSAFDLTQENFQYYFAAFNSVNYDNFRNCKASTPCKIECEAIIITLDDEGKKENILVVKSIRKIK